jgi:hypothetical protein
MNVLSSISSSNQRLPRLAWARLLMSGGALLLLSVIALETALAWRGILPSLDDSYGLWQTQRLRADQLGSRALILVGNSRMQNDVDLGTLRRDTGLEPVQLAIGGTSFLPVLQGLAEDPRITGTVIVNFEADALALPPCMDLAYHYQSDYVRHGQLPGFFQTENWLADRLHFHLRSYADGTRPLTALLVRVMQGQSGRQFQDLDPERQVRIDFTRSNNTARYALVRAVHELGPPFAYDPHMSDAELEAALKTAVTEIKPADADRFMAREQTIIRLASAIDARGGRVLFVLFPRAGLVREIDDKRYPRASFWQPLVTSEKDRALDYETVPALQDFDFPDGSHLDERDQVRFTQALAAALHLDKGGAL